MTIVLDGTTGITNDGGYTGDGVVFADTTPANTLVTTTGGNVGIGTSSPTSIAGYKSVTVSSTTGGWLEVTNGTVRGALQNGSGDVTLETRSAHPLLFGVNGSEKGRFSISGALLVGSSSDTGSKLHVSGNLGSVRGNNPSSIRITNLDTGQYATLSAGAVGADNGGFELSTDGVRRLIISGTGNLGVPGVYNLTTGAGANVHVASDGTIYRSTSSLKYKTDVQDATHGLADVMQLRPVTYKGNNDGELVFGGLIAEEVHEAGLTEFVQYAEDGTPDALAYANMVSLAFKAIQEQQALILAQESALTALTARVTALEGA